MSLVEVQVDKYTKVVLTVIAVALTVIALRMGQPEGAYGRLLFGSAPTYGDFLALREIVGDSARRDAQMKLLRNMPMVRVQGGQIDADVSGSVRIDR